MISTLDSLLPHITPEVSSCPANFISQALRITARNFFAQTEVWQKEFEDVDVVADQQLYNLDPAETSGTEPEVRRIVWVKLSGAEISADYYDLVLSVTAGVEFDLEWDDDHIPESSITDGMDYKLVLVPNWESTYVNPFQLTRWGDAIAAGTKALLLSQSNKPWTNLRRAEYWEDQYLLGTNAAVKERYTGRKTGSTRIALQGDWL